MGKPKLRPVSPAPPAQSLRRRILLAVSAAHGNVSTATVSGLLSLGRDLASRGIDVDLMAPSSPEDTHYLDIVANRALEDSRTSHILFVGPNIRFNPQFVTALLDQTVPIAAASVPDAQLDLETLHEQIASGVALARLGEGAPRFVASDRLPMNFALVSRRVLQTMVERRCVERFRMEPADPDGEGVAAAREYFGFFSPVRAAPSEPQLQLAQAFSHRWRVGCQGEILLTDDLPIETIGTIKLSARFSELRSNTG